MTGATVRVEGVVQGVGFRPFVHRIAMEAGLAGHVLNDSAGVLVEVEGDADAVDGFLAALRDAPPPLARVERITVRDRPSTGAHGFAIVASPVERSSAARVPITADSATCEDCLRELRDPADRRHRYPFVNCTNCGPRFTIVQDVPYDRSRTTMSSFVMCAACQAEYDDPGDRRFHAQPNACGDCGPQARLVGGRIAVPPGPRDAVSVAADLLRDGAVVAVKGLGGYHLACRADDDVAVASLRARKHREDRPFALMVRDVAAARRLVRLDDGSAAELVSRARPIVLAPRAPGAGVAASVAPRSAELGVMLPCAPLQHLLLDDLQGVALVMTSGNVSDEPIAYGDADALERLGGIADALLVHDRPIHMRADDGVVRVAAGGPVVVRRSRGHVPDAIRLPVPARRDVLAVGAELKATVCLARGDRAWVGHHLGDLRNAAVLGAFTDGIDHLERLLDVCPQLIAHDLHPDHLSTAYALDRDGVDLCAVQHHHAHLAACLAEHGIAEGVTVGAIYDGSGYGPDGTVWGGEILAGDLRGFERIGSLHPVRLPGGDRAAREPWRMACAWLVATVGPDAPRPAAFGGEIDEASWAAVRDLAVRGFCSPQTTSMGRLFDAVGALCGLRTHVSYEGQAAIELEAVVDPTVRDAYDLPVGKDGQMDARVTVAAVVADLAGRVELPTIAARFHGAVAAGTAEACARAASAAGTDRVVLSGGVFLNRVLLEATAERLTAAGLRVLIPRRFPPGDGGISLGQAAVAAARDAASGLGPGRTLGLPPKGSDDPHRSSPTAALPRVHRANGRAVRSLLELRRRLDRAPVR